jgi:hypothetical protein
MIRIWIFGLAAAVVAVLALGGCGAGGTGDVTVTPEMSAEQMAQTAHFDGLESGEAGVNVFVRRSKWGAASFTVSGEFEKLAGRTLPLLQAYASTQARVGGRHFEFNGRLFLLPDHVLFVYGPAFHEVPYMPSAADFKRLKMKVEKAQGEGGRGDALACLDAVGGLKPSDLIHHFSREGKRELADGTNVFLLGARISISRFIDVLIEMAEDPGCGAQLEAVGLPPVAELEAIKAQLKEEVEEAPITIGIDKNGVIRYVIGRVKFTPPSGEEVEVRIRGWLNKPNEPVATVDSSRGKPWAMLLRKFGVEPKTVLAAGGDELLIGFLRGLSNGLYTGRL